MTKNDAQTRNQESAGTRFSRRTVTRGIAWTAPVVAVASAAPAFASSHCEIKLEIDYEGSCKKANEAKYNVTFKLTTNGGCVVPPGCADGSKITRIVEGNQGPNAEVLFNQPGGSPIGTPITLCGVDQQSGSIIVTASIPCIEDGAELPYDLKLNQQGSAVADCDPADPLPCTIIVPEG